MPDTGSPPPLSQQRQDIIDNLKDTGDFREYGGDTDAPMADTDVPQINEDEAYAAALYVHIANETGIDPADVADRYERASGVSKRAWKESLKNTYPGLFSENESGRSGIDALRFDFARVLEPSERSSLLESYMRPHPFPDNPNNRSAGFGTVDHIEKLRQGGAEESLGEQWETPQDIGDYLTGKYGGEKTPPLKDQREALSRKHTAPQRGDAEKEATSKTDGKTDGKKERPYFFKSEPLP